MAISAKSELQAERPDVLARRTASAACTQGTYAAVPDAGNFLSQHVLPETLHHRLESSRPIASSSTDLPEKRGNSKHTSGTLRRV
ncbi:unnamed protein product [Zymoseptoria tritici ST99CH_3D7]|uniref:Uncharacterized protein n=1 Tax=Zymoseptoria tritici (strain ST99CH_3D7) TaxID=1276538 RepID=A0A1X7S1X1_ZYMT9|nr:unnamed protein product [Zymoseptoria tritici ST99CH_3D7]